MEVIVQWLDDLEDLIFALPLAWERLRVWCLQIGLVAALILGAIQLSRVLIAWAPTFAGTALLSVGIWATGLAITEIADLRRQIVRSNVHPTA